MRLSFHNQLKSALNEYLENISQSLFFAEAKVGGIFLAIFLVCEPFMALCGVAGSLIGFVDSILSRTPVILRRTGLMTINGFFFGIAMAFLFKPSLAFCICFMVGALAVPLLTKATFEVLQHWKLTPLIFPYIISILILWLCADRISLRVNDFVLVPPISWHEEASLALSQTFFQSVGQIFFLPQAFFGLAIIGLVLFFDLRKGLFLFLGSALASLSFFLISRGDYSWQGSFFCSSAGLVSLGLASMHERFAFSTILVFSVVCLFTTLALERLFVGFGLPVLSLPYVLTFWFANLSRSPRCNISWAPPELP